MWYHRATVRSIYGYHMIKIMFLNHQIVPKVANVCYCSVLVLENDDCCVSQNIGKL